MSWSGEREDHNQATDDQVIPPNQDESVGSAPISSLNIIPPSPNEMLNTLTHHDVDDHLPENPSEPSSPASFTSMPSYVASVSSVSRTSSPLGSAGDFARQVGAASQDLVLPMLSLPSTSLHMSLRRWEGEFLGIKVVLAGSQEATQKIIRGLGERSELAEMGRKGEVGIVRAGRVEGMLITGLSSEQVSPNRSHGC